MNKFVTVLLAAAILTGCGASESSSDAETSFIPEGEKVEAEMIEEAKAENPYIFLPDGVRLDDTKQVREVLPDEEGYINIPELGFKYPDPTGMKTLLYEWSDPKAFNLTCQVSAFITGSFFPDVNDHIRLCTYTDIEPVAEKYDGYISRLPELRANMLEEEFNEGIKENMKKHIPFFAAREVSYCYDYIDVGSGGNKDKDENWYPPKPDDVSFDPFNVSVSDTSARQPAPDSERTNVTSEFIERGDKCFGIRICYDQKRYGVEMTKHVYWLFVVGQSRMHRIEFSYDKRTEHQFNEETFLDSLELSEPAETWVTD